MSALYAGIRRYIVVSARECIVGVGVSVCAMHIGVRMWVRGRDIGE